MSSKRKKTRLDRTAGRNRASTQVLPPGTQTTPEPDPSFDPKVPEITANYREIEIFDPPHQGLPILDPKVPEITANYREIEIFRPSASGSSDFR